MQGRSTGKSSQTKGEKINSFETRILNQTEFYEQTLLELFNHVYVHYGDRLQELSVAEVLQRKFPRGVNLKISGIFEYDSTGSPEKQWTINIAEGYILSYGVVCSPSKTIKFLRKKFERTLKLRRFWKKKINEMYGQFEQFKLSQKLPVDPTILSQVSRTAYNPTTNTTSFDFQVEQYISQLSVHDTANQFAEALMQEKLSLDDLEWLLGLRDSSTDDLIRSLGAKEKEVLLKIYNDSEGTTDEVRWEPSAEWSMEFLVLNRSSETSARSQAKGHLKTLGYVSVGDNRRRVRLTQAGLDVAKLIEESLTKHP